MKNKAILLVLSLFLFTNVSAGSAASYTPDQLVGQAEAYGRQLAPLINYEKTKTIKAAPTTLVTGTKTRIANAKTAVSKLKIGTARQKLETRIKAVEVTYGRSVTYNNSIGVGERMKLKALNLLNSYNANPSSDATNLAYSSLQAELGKFARSLGLVYGKSTRDAISVKYKGPAEVVLNQTRTAAILKSEMNLLSNALKTSSNETVFKQVDRFNAQLGKTKSNRTLYNSFVTPYETLLREKGLSTNGVPTIILKKIISHENSVVYLEVYDENNKPLSQGSGFIVGKSTILTNFHVIQDGYRVVAYDNEGREIAVRGVVKYDEETDLALLGTVVDMALPALQTGSIDTLEKGDPIVTIGSPEGLVNTVSTGIISNLHVVKNDGRTTNLIQITAPITHGSSGGALFNEYGEVIGVTSSGMDSGNLNFAVGINHAQGWISAFGNSSASSLTYIPYNSLPGSGEGGPVITPPPAPEIPAGPAPVYNSKLVIGSKMRETVMHPDKPILYGLSDGKDVIELNLETKQARKITLNLAPERLFFANNELYVTLPKGEHNSMWMDPNQEGAFAVINADTMTLIDQVDITMDPFDIVADSKFIYVSSGSGQWTTLRTFSRSSLLETDAYRSIRDGSFLEIHPDGGKVYSITPNQIPKDPYAHTFMNGKYLSNYNSPYHGEYPLSGIMNISPDGQYMFFGSGVVFRSSSAQASDMTYITQMNQTYEEIAFDLSNNRFYTSSGKGLDVYDYSGFEKLKHYDLPHEIESMFVKNREFIIVYKEGTKQVVKKYPLTEEGLLTISTSATPAVPEQFVSITGTGLQQPKIPISISKAEIGSDFREEISHPTKPIIYGLTSGKEVIEYNMATKQIRKLAFSYTPDQLFFANNELYVSLKKPQTGSNPDGEGAFAVVDAESMTLIKEVDIPMDPFDIVADAGYIYISNNAGGSWTNIKAFSRATFLETGNVGSVYRASYLKIHPDGGKLYATNGGTSPRDYYMFQFTEGKFTRYYDSPYHGDYNFDIKMNISPDGRYIFSGNGVVLHSSLLKENDMKYVTKLYNRIEEIAFDLNSSRFYTSSGKGLDVFDYSSFERLKHYELPHDIDYMAVQDKHLIVIYKETAPGALLPKKVVKKYPLTENGLLTMIEQ